MSGPRGPPPSRTAGSRSRDTASCNYRRQEPSRPFCEGATGFKAPSSPDYLGPGGLDPVRCRGRLVVGRAGLRPAERCGDVPDRNGDDPARIPARELILGKVLAEPGDRVLVGLVVGPHVEIARWRIDAEALELADDRFVVGPAAGQLVGPLDGGFQQVERHIFTLRLEVGVLVPALEVTLDEALVQRPAVAARIGEVIIGVDPGEHALGVILADRM